MTESYSLFPGLEEDDPLKRETQRLAAGNLVWDLIMGQRVYGPPLTVSPVGDLTPLQWSGTFAGFDGHTIGGTHTAAVTSLDDEGSYIARDGPGGAGGSYVDRLDLGATLLEGPYNFFVEYRACTLFAPPVAPSGPAPSAFLFAVRPVGTGVYTSGELDIYTGAYALAQDTFRTFTAPLALTSTESVRAGALFDIGIQLSPSFAGYVALTWARIKAVPK